jgi:uncharacterized membrane protein YqjE
MRSQHDRSNPDVLHAIIGNVHEIVRSELQLAKTEVAEHAAEARAPAATLAVGGVLAVYALGLLLLSVVYALATRMAMWSAALLVSAALAVVAMLLMKWGSQRIKRIGIRAEKRMASLKENLQWAKDQTG